MLVNLRDRSVLTVVQVCCHTEIEVADQTLSHPVTVYWPGSHWSTNFKVSGVTPPGKRPTAEVGVQPRSATLEVGAIPLGQQGSIFTIKFHVHGLADSENAHRNSCFMFSGVNAKKCRVSGLSRGKKKSPPAADGKQQKIREMFSRFAHQK